MIRKHIHSQPLLVINGGVHMVKALAEIGGIDDGDNATKVFHGVDA